MKENSICALKKIISSILHLSIDPLDPLTEQGEVLCEFHHGNDRHTPSHHTRWPEERMEQHVGAVEFG